ncbi:hypothetical protein OH407_24645, partial [Salmonella enterica]|nr:hypothetical protein [Salmonella enterica]
GWVLPAVIVAALCGPSLAPAARLSAEPVHVPAAAPTSPVPVATAEGITEYRLPNGLRVLLAPDAAQPTTTVNITYLVGSRHEN